MLEASLRKLVREEAANAAVATVTAIGDQLAGAVTHGARAALSDSIGKLDRHRSLIWTHPRLPDDLLAARQLSREVDDAKVLNGRTRALELAVAASPAGSEAEMIAARAAVFAAFLLDGVPAMKSLDR